MPTRTWRGTIDSNWGTAGNWLEGAVPTSADDVVFDVSSSACTVNASARSCLTINFSAYTNTITMSNTITVGGDVTLGSSMIISGSSALIVNANATLRSNGRVWSNPLTLSGTSRTYTLADNWTVSNVLTLNGTTSQIINGSTIYSSGNLTSNTTAITSGTTNIELNGGTWSNSSTGVLRNNLTFNGNVSVNGNVYYNTGTLTYTGGTVTTTGSTLNIGASTTLNTSGMTWNNVTFGATNTTTLLSNLNVNGLINVGGTTTINGSFNINANSGITLTFGINQGTGSPALNLLGGTWSGGGGITLNTNLNGNVTISGSVGFGIGTLKYISGTITTNGSLMTPTANCTIDTNGMSFWGWRMIYVVTLLSDLTISNGMISSGDASFNGPYNIYVSNGININHQLNSAASPNKATVHLLSGTVIAPSTSGILANLVINGNVTFSGNIYVSSNTITYSGGTVSHINSTLRIVSSTLNTSGMTWNNVTMHGTVTLLSDYNVSDSLTATSTLTVNGSFNINVNNGVFLLTNCEIIKGTGTPRLYVKGGTLSCTNTIGSLRIDTFIDGNVTMGSLVVLANSATLTHQSGTLTSTGNTLTVLAATTITVNNTGFTLNNINTSANVTFAGTNGFPINGTYTCTTPGTTHTFVSTQTYSINSLNIAGTNASRVTLRSSSSGSKAIINLNSVQSEYYLNVTDIDGSGGATGWTFGGTVTNSDNWNASTTLYYVGTSNFSATGSWAPYSGGVPIGSISAPASTDDTAFDVNSVNNCNMNAAGNCKSVNFSGYTATLTMTNTMTVSGNVTLASGMSISGSSALIVNATHTFTSNGKTWPNPLVFTGSITITLTDDLTILGLFSLNLSVANTVMVFNGTVNINCYGGFTNNGDTGVGTSQGTGTTTLNIYGGTWSGQGMTRLDTNIIGNVTISTVRFSVRKLTHISGNVIALGNSWISGTLDVAGIRWNDIFNGGGTLLSDFNVGGVLGINNGGFGGAFNVNCYGGISVGNFLQNATGASAPTVNLYGGVFCPTTAIQGLLNCNINILGDITIGDVILDTSNTVRYVSGNVRSTSNSILRITQNGNVLLNCDKVNFRNVTITAGRTITMNRFFNGTITAPTRVRCTTAGSIYFISFQDNLEKVAHNVKVSDCVVSNRNQLLLTGANSNKGTNTGIRYINNVPNGIARNQAPISNQMMFGIGNISDPSFVAN